VIGNIERVQGLKLVKMPAKNTNPRDRGVICVKEPWTALVNACSHWKKVSMPA
jgi:hypothetical protein